MLKKHYILISCILLCVSNSCFSWWSGGHMIVAQIAYNNLTTITRMEVGDILNHPLDFSSASSAHPPPAHLSELATPNEEHDTFLLASIWPDAIKSYNWGNLKEQKIYEKLHFLNVKFDAEDRTNCLSPKTSWLKKIEDAIKNSRTKKEGDIVSGIESSLKTLMTPSESKTNKGIALHHLIHLVGDIHQPYHLSDSTFIYHRSSRLKSHPNLLMNSWLR